MKKLDYETRLLGAKHKRETGLFQNNPEGFINIEFHRALKALGPRSFIGSHWWLDSILKTD